MTTSVPSAPPASAVGRHLIVDLHGASRLDDLALMDSTLRRCVQAAGATLLHIHLHHFQDHGGISGVAVLAESHISVHTWPEAAYAAFDLFMCGAADPQRAVAVLQASFEPRDMQVHTIHRGPGA